MRRSLRKSLRGRTNTDASSESFSSAPSWQETLDTAYGSFLSGDDDEPSYQAFLDGPAVQKRCVVGIDFGTTNSGFAYALTSDRKTKVVKKKEPTCMLFKKSDHSLIEFGIAARDYYRKTQAGAELLTKFTSTETSTWSEDYEFIDQDIKMRLFEEAQETQIDELQHPLTSSGLTYFEIVSAVLEKVKEDAMTRIRRDLEDDFDFDVPDVLWVLTVPSIWRESDKQFMRRCARRAGLIRDEFSGDLVIALESECAAIWAEAVFEHRKHQRLREGEVVLCLDCGGGTVDISAVKILQTHKDGSSELEMRMAQLLPPTGIKTGSQDIDRMFREFLMELLGEENFEIAWNQPEARMELQDGWERMKTSFKLESFLDIKQKRPKYFNLETTLTEINEKLHDLVVRFNKTQRMKHDVKAVQVEYKRTTFRPATKLMMSPELLRYFFDPVVFAILEKTQKVIDTLLMGEVDHLILYGGLGSSPYLRHQIGEQLEGKMRLHTPKHASLAVMKGAVKYGFFPSIIRSRRARMTVGIKVSLPFVRNKHNKKPHIDHKEYDSNRREYLIRDAFKPFVTRGQLVDTEEKYKHTFTAPANRDTIKFDIYASPADHVEYVTEPGCEHLARLVVPIDKEKGKQKLVCALSFGYTEIRAYILTPEGDVISEVPVLYDRHGENAIMSQMALEEEVGMPKLHDQQVKHQQQVQHEEMLDELPDF